MYINPAENELLIEQFLILTTVKVKVADLLDYISNLTTKYGQS